MTRLISAIFCALCLMGGAAFAHDYKIGELEILHPHARATPPNAPVSGGYMTIRNGGAAADRLIGGAADFAGKIEIHEMVMDGDVMRMREIEGGLEIPAGGEVVLKPGGYHVMFMRLKEQMKPGERRKVTLKFRDAGAIDVDFSVEEIKPGHGMDHGKMNEGGMSHSGHDRSGTLMPDQDTGRIVELLKQQFDRPEAPLSVAPVVISGRWAVAGWSQEGQGGRAILARSDHGWQIRMCGGEGFKHAGNLEKMGMPRDDAARIAGKLAAAEAELGADSIARFDSFEGVVEISADGHHGDAHSGAHGHRP